MIESDALRLRTVGADDAEALVPAMVRMLANAYPVMRLNDADALDAFTARLRAGIGDTGTSTVVAEYDGELAGVMRLYDFTMNVRGADALTGGVGSVAVGMPYKKRGIARAMIAWYLQAYRQRGAPFAALFPFRLDFYRALGFGYGAPVYRYAFVPATLRPSSGSERVRLLGEADVDALGACYERIRIATHGLMTRPPQTFSRALRDPQLQLAGVERDGVLRGFLQMSVQLPSDGSLRNRDVLVVRDLLAEDASALAGLVRFLRSQGDQFARITIESGDPALFLASEDPRDGSDVAVSPPAAHRYAEAGLGVMYRIIDIDAALACVPPARDAFALRIDVRDDVVPALAGTRTVRFGDGTRSRRDDAARPDATLGIGIADLSSVVMGSLRLRDVVAHGLATLEPPSRLPIVDAAFRADAPPQCATRF